MQQDAELLRIRALPKGAIKEILKAQPQYGMGYTVRWCEQVTQQRTRKIWLMVQIRKVVPMFDP
jgi:hypothetical protein